MLLAAERKSNDEFAEYARGQLQIHRKWNELHKKETKLLAKRNKQLRGKLRKKGKQVTELKNMMVFMDRKKKKVHK